MALVINGKTTCKLCGNVLNNSSEIVMLPAFVYNELDWLAYFNDEAFHKECFYKHPQSDEVTKRVEELYAELSANPKVCIVCNKEIFNPDDYLFLGNITNTVNDDLIDYNYKTLHSTCLSVWNDVYRFYRLLNDSNHKGLIKGAFYKNLIAKISDELNI